MALKWFKFYPQRWITGRIMLETDATQGAFLKSCMLLFTREGDVDEEYLREFIKNDRAVDRLIKRGFIQIENDTVFIEWIAEEIDGALNRSQSAKQNASKRWDGKATAMRPHSGGNANIKEENTTVFRKPTKDQVVKYFEENNKSKDDGIRFFLYYESQGWVKSNGLKMKNWKATCQTWWRKDDKEKPKFNIIK